MSKKRYLFHLSHVTIFFLLTPFFVFSQEEFATSSTSTSTEVATSSQPAEQDSDDGIDVATILAIGAGIIAGGVLISELFNPTRLIFFDFGGRIAAIQPVCVSPPAALINIGVPKPAQLMYVFGTSFSYSHGPPRNPGQSLLGRAALTPVPCLVPCPAGLCPHPQGGGLPILFHGSSAI